MGNQSQISIQSDFLSRTGFSGFLECEMEPQVLEWDRNERFPFETFGRFYDFGVMLAAFRKADGGTELPMIDLLMTARKLASHSPGAFSSWVAHLFAQTAVSRFATRGTARDSARELSCKRGLMAMAATEKDTGTDVFRLKTLATPRDGGYEISGEKYWITNANYAEQFVVLTALPSLPNEQPLLAAFVLDRSQSGVVVGPPIKKLGHRESNTSSLRLERVFVPASRMLGHPGQGGEILTSCISRSKTLIAAAAVGICERAEKEAVDYLSRTERGGRSLISRHDLQGILVRHRVEAEAAWLLACRSAAVWERDGTAICEASQAKLYASNAAVAMVSEALELTGATGYLQDGILAKLYRDAKLLEIYEGASSIQSAWIATQMFSKSGATQRVSNDRKAA